MSGKKVVQDTVGQIENFASRYFSDVATLCVGALAFTVGSAWNNAMQSGVARFLPKNPEKAQKHKVRYDLIIAGALTLIAVLITTALTTMLGPIKKHSSIGV